MLESRKNDPDALTDEDLRQLEEGTQGDKPSCVTVWAKGGLEMDALGDLDKQINSHMDNGYVIQAGSLLHYTSSPFTGEIIHNFVVLMVYSERY